MCIDSGHKISEYKLSLVYHRTGSRQAGAASVWHVLNQFAPALQLRGWRDEAEPRSLLALGDVFRGYYGSTGLTVGLDDPKDLFQLSCFYSIIAKWVYSHIMIHINVFIPY